MKVNLMSQAPSDFLQLFNDWQGVGSVLGAIILSVATLFAFMIRHQRDFWRDRVKILNEHIQTLLKQFETERAERSAKEAEIERLRKEVIELREVRVDNIRQEIAKGEQYALDTIRQLEEYAHQLEAQLKEKSLQLAKLNADNAETRKELYVLRAEANLRNDLLEKLNSDVRVLEIGIEANNAISENLETAILDDTQTGRLLTSYKTKIANLRSEAIAKAVREEYQTQKLERDRRALEQEKKARARSEAGDVRERQGMVIKAPLPDSPKQK